MGENPIPDRIGARINQWRSQLLDLTKRNRLINCKIGKSGAIAVEFPQAPDIWERIVIDNAAMRFPLKSVLLEHDDEDENQLTLLDTLPGSNSPKKESAEWKDCITSPHLDEKDLLTALADKQLSTRLYRLSLAAQTSLSERGINTLYAAFGLLKWYESQDSDIAIVSPLLLVPIKMSRQSTDSLWEMSLHEEEVAANHSLAEILRLNFRLEMPEVDEDRLMERRTALNDYFEEVRKCVSGHKRWEVIEAVCIGNFSFQKLAMWTDLGKNGHRIGGHEICRAIGGESADLGSTDGVPLATELDDKVTPQENHHILDADSSQHEAILAAKSGVNLILDGPPGTGKSQTIANLIAEMVAQGKTILFVSEKAAALEVVKRRLDRQGLGDFCLECHSHKANKKEVVAELGRSLALPPEHHDQQEGDLEDLRLTRDRLNGYVRAIHKKRGALKLSAFQVHGRLAKLLGKPTSRYVTGKPLDVDIVRQNEMVRAISQLCDVAETLMTGSAHPWYGAAAESYSLTLEDDVKHHFRLLASRLPQLLNAAGELGACGFVGRRPTWRDIRNGFDAANRALSFPLLPLAWFEGNARMTADRFIELDKNSALARTLAESIPEYADDAPASHDSAWLAALRPGDPWCGRLRQSPQTVRSLNSALSETFERLGKVLASLSALKTATERLVGEFKVGLVGELTMEHYPKLAELGERVSRTGELDLTWFDPRVRAQLRHAAGECTQERARLASDRERLRATFAPHAFKVDALNSLNSAREFGSFWSRLRPSWKRVRRELGELLEDGKMLSTRALLDSAARLRRHHSHVAGLETAERGYASSGVNYLPDGAHWPRVLSGLDEVEMLERGGPITPKLKESLCKPGLIDRAAVGEAVATLKTAIAALGTEVEEAWACVEVSVLDPKRLWESGRSFKQLGEWVVAGRKALHDRIEVIGLITARLRETADVPSDRCAADFAVLDQINRLHERIEQLQNQLGLTDSGPKPVHARSWNSEAGLARSVLELLSIYGDSLPVPVLRSVTDDAIRTRVASGVTSIREASDDGLCRSWEFLESLFPTGRTASFGTELQSAPLEELPEWLHRRSTDPHRLAEWINLAEVSRNLDLLGLSSIHGEVAASAYPAVEAVDAFLQRFYRLWLDAAYAEDPHLRRFDIDEHDRIIQRFRELDRACLRETYKRVRTAQLSDRHLLASGSRSAPASSEAGILLRETNKKRRQLPLRLLFERMPNLLKKLKPCLMMSPLAVSTYLDSALIEFDLVVFDEASQVRPHDAICAIYRGKQLVVAGDQKQLPPSAFFERGLDDEEEDDEGGTISVIPRTLRASLTYAPP